MTKVIPIVIAILIFLGAGVYVLSNRAAKLPQSPVNNTANPPNGTSATASPVETPAPVYTAPTVDQSKNQITLKITSPVNNATVATPVITIKGVTIPGADVAVNDKEVTAGPDGSFAVGLSLDEGDNYISVVATDADGKAAETDLNVTLNTGN
jgi:hypothetical protein